MCLLLASAVATPLRASGASSAIAVELVPGDTQWEVRHALPRPVRELRFTRVDPKGVAVAALLRDSGGGRVEPGGALQGPAERAYRPGGCPTCRLKAVLKVLAEL